MTLTDSMNQKQKNDLHIIASIALISAISCALRLSFLGYIAIFAVLLFVILKNPSDFFLLFLAISPFTAAFTIGGKGIFGFLIIASVLKMFLYKKYYSKTVFLAGIVLIALELANDFANINIGIFVSMFASVLLFFMYTAYLDYNRLNVNEMLITLAITCFLEMLAVYIANGGNIAVYENDVNSMIRLGATEWQAAGAMEIPVYALMGICSLVVILMKNKTSLLIKILSMAAIVFELYLSVLSLSRVFYLGLFAAVFFLLFFLFGEKKKGRAMVTISVLAMAVIAFWSWKGDYILLAFQRMMNRQMSDFSSGRLDIWKSCVEYLSSHPLRLLIGNGMRNYTQVGASLNADFSMSAHNLILDAVMSFGLIGCISLISIFAFSIKQLKRIYPVKALDMNKLPLLVYLVMKMTGGMFYYFQTFTFLMVLIYISYSRNGAVKPIPICADERIPRGGRVAINRSAINARQ